MLDELCLDCESDLAQDDCGCPESIAHTASWNFFDCLIVLVARKNVYTAAALRCFLLGNFFSGVNR